MTHGISYHNAEKSFKNAQFSITVTIGPEPNFKNELKYYALTSIIANFIVYFNKSTWILFLLKALQLKTRNNVDDCLRFREASNHRQEKSGE